MWDWYSLFGTALIEEFASEMYGGPKESPGFRWMRISR
jgi:hypothetical protein